MQLLSAEVKALDTELAEIDAKLTEFTTTFQTSLLICPRLERWDDNLDVAAEHRANLALTKSSPGFRRRSDILDWERGAKVLLGAVLFYKDLELA